MNRLKQYSEQRVLVIGPQPFYEDRGTPIALAYISQALAELGMQVDLLTYPIGSDLHIEGTRIVRAKNPLRIDSVPIGFSLRKLLLDGPLFLEASRLIKKNEYFRIHAVEEAVFAAIFLCRKYQNRIIYDMASSLPEQMMRVPGFGNQLSQRLLNSVERWALSRVGNITCSAGLGEKVRAIVPLTPVSEWLFPAPFDRKLVADGTGIRTELGLGDDIFVVCYTGSFAKYQGIRTLVKSIPAVLQEHADVAFVMVGGSEAEIADIVEIIPANLIDRVKIIPRQDRKRIASYLDAADILLSTREEGCNLPLKVFDYLAAGKPIIASDIPAHRSVLTGDMAMFFEPGAEGLSRAIHELISNPEKARQLGANAARFARDNLSWEAFRDSVARIYRNNPPPARASIRRP